MADHKLSFTDFDKVSAEEWEHKITKDLKGGSSDQLGLPISEDLRMPIGISSTADIMAGNIPHSGKFPLITAAPSPLDNPTLLDALMGGANSLFLDLHAQINWSELLDQVDLSFLDMAIKGDQSTILAFFEYMDQNRACGSGENIGCTIPEEIALFQKFGKQHTTWRFFSCRAMSDAKDPIASVAAFLQAANDRLESLDEAGLISQSANSFSCRLSVGTNYLHTIMTIRAVRLVWALLLDAWKLDAQIPIFIHCESDETIFSDGDVEKTMIRSTSLATAALTGGANGIWIKPMYEGEAKGNFYQRIARNNLHLFEQEGKLGWVEDPVAGAKYFEHGANQIAEQAWNQFRAI